MKKILILNGPNLNLVGSRNTEIYGEHSLEQIKDLCQKKAHMLDISLDFIQSNHEGNIIDLIHSAQNNYCAIIINPGAYAHYSVAIRDAIESVAIPTIEVHFSNIFAREPFRNNSVIAPVCTGQICGFGVGSYLAAVDIAGSL